MITVYLDFRYYNLEEYVSINVIYSFPSINYIH